MEIRRVTREDLPAIKQFYVERGDDLVRPSLVSWLGEVDGKIEGHAGFAFAAGYWIGFCDLNEAARAHPITVIRMSYKAMTAAKEANIRYVFVQEDTREPTAARWLWTLGFRPDLKNPQFMRWRAKDWRA